MPVFERPMVTGHRPKGLTIEQQAWSQVTLAKVAHTMKHHYGAQHAISGFALGADTWWALSALSAGLSLHAYIPFEAQADGWSAEDTALWKMLRAAATTEKIVGGQGYDVRMLHARNDAMLQDCDFVVALLRSDSTRGGTFSAVSKAKKLGRPILLVDPVKQTLTRFGW